MSRFVSVTSGSVVATYEYDGRGRRIVKQVTNSADYDATYHVYYDGESAVETRNGSDQTIKQQVWGLTYLDELVQQGINTNFTADSSCETAYWACQDANYCQ